MNEVLKDELGTELLGYIERDPRVFQGRADVEEEGALVCEDSVDSFRHLVYPVEVFSSGFTVVILGIRYSNVVGGRCDHDADRVRFEDALHAFKAVHSEQAYCRPVRVLGFEEWLFHSAVPSMFDQGEVS